MNKELKIIRPKLSTNTSNHDVFKVTKIDDYDL